MADKLVWTARALKKYDKLLDYLLEEWNETIALKVVERIEESTLRIKQFPEQFPLISENRQVHQCVVSPQTSLFFKFDGNQVVVLSLFDNRQDPGKLKL